MSDAAELLNRAADIIDECGLHKGEYWPGRIENKSPYQEGAPCCVAGAFVVAAGHRDTATFLVAPKPEREIAQDAWVALAETVPRSWWDLTDWNDAPDTTKADVVAALRAAAGAR